jgi:hypothetical protein
LLSRFGNNGVACDKGGSNLSCKNRQWKIPGTDAANDPPGMQGKLVGFTGWAQDWRRRWNEWDDIAVVDYDHGWAIQEADIVQDESDEGDVDRMPSDIRLVALRLAAGQYQQASAGTSSGMRSESLGAYSYTRMDGALGTGILSAPEKMILDRYRVKKVPVP